MPKIAYIEKRLSRSRLDTIATANRIIDEFIGAVE